MTFLAVERKVKRFTQEPLRPGDPLLRPKGNLLIIGGHEDKKDGKTVLRELAGIVDGGKLVVTTVASDVPRDVWETYEGVFRAIGVSHVHHLNLESRADASSARAMAVLEGADAVFFTGGDQLKITTRIGDTPIFSRMYEIFVNGGTIAGTSAGASIMSETMMVRGNGDESHRVDEGLQLAPGLGFAKDMIVDQHFAERGRIGRLLGVVGQNPRILGIGIDENTAIMLQPHREFRVLGEGAVTVLDGRHVTYSNIAEEETGCTMSVFGVTLHLLGAGDVFDLRHREPRGLRDKDDPLGERRAKEKNGNGSARAHGNGTGRRKSRTAKRKSR
jgi:cyanophycinase